MDRCPFPQLRCDPPPTRCLPCGCVTGPEPYDCDEAAELRAAFYRGGGWADREGHAAGVRLVAHRSGVQVSRERVEARR